MTLIGKLHSFEYGAPERIEHKRTHPRDMGAPVNKEELVEGISDGHGSTVDMKTVYDEWGYARTYTRSQWSQVSGPPEGPPQDPTGTP